MKPGPPPTPTAIRIAKGNPSRRPLPPDEPAPDRLADLTPPECLSDAAKLKWAELAPLLRDLGVLTVADRDALSLLAESWARWAEAERRIRVHGLVVTAGPGSSVPMISPYLSIARHAQREVSRLLEQFGCTPSSRSRVSAVPATAPDGDHTRFFGPVAVVPPPRKRR